MEKIRINLVSGSSLEKPLITAFKSNSAMYVVLDNEINGTMGLPIILVSKIENNRLVKINDQNEWNAIKETLRMIIAGNQVDYVVVNPMLSAEDMFFSQLTLPVASFDALKNNYRPNVDNAAASGTTVMPNVVENIAPVSNVDTSSVAPASSPVAPQVSPSTPVTDANPQMASPNVTPQVSAASDTPVAPVMPSARVDEQSVAPVTPASPVTPPVVEEIKPETPAVPVDFTADKEAFLKACENMFDALVAKFKN